MKKIMKEVKRKWALVNFVLRFITVVFWEGNQCLSAEPSLAILENTSPFVAENLDCRHWLLGWSFLAGWIAQIASTH